MELLNAEEEEELRRIEANYSGLGEHPGRIEPKAKESELELAKSALGDAEEELLQEYMTVLKGAAKFAELDPKDPLKIPEEWIAQYGAEKAAILHRCAMFALAPAKNAPIGLTIAQRGFVGITTARARRRQAPATLNLQVNMVMAPVAPQRKVIDVEPNG